MLFVSDDPAEAEAELSMLTSIQLEKYEELVGLVATDEAAAMNVADGIEECMTVEQIQDDARRALVRIRSHKKMLVN